MLSPWIDVFFLILSGIACTFQASAGWRATWWAVGVSNAVFLVLDLQKVWHP